MSTPDFWDKPQHIPTDTISFRLLTGEKLRDLFSLQRALTTLHDVYEVPNVAISSIPVTEWLLRVLPSHIHPGTFDDPAQGDDRFLLCLTSSKSGRLPNPNENSLVHACCIEKIPGYFSGVGDLFSALLLGHYRPAAEDEPKRDVRDDVFVTRDIIRARKDSRSFRADLFTQSDSSRGRTSERR